MRARAKAFIQGLLLLLLLCLMSPCSHADDWLPISADDLGLRKEDKAPGAPAIFLYRQVDRDDSGNGSEERVYERIKILTEEGRKYGSVEIEYFKGESSIHGVEARTIRPDGSIAKFSGEIYDQSILKTNGLKYNVKTINLPDVQVGSIVEYRYRRSYVPFYIFGSNWILSAELFTRNAKFSLLPYPEFGLRWAWPAGLPDGATVPLADKGRKIHMEVHDVPAFVTEDFMPPKEDLEMRVDFVYSDDPSTAAQKDPEVFWQRHFKQLFKSLNNFMDEPKAMQKAVAEIVTPSDPPDQKLLKIYARVQQMRNLSFEREMDEDELKHQGIHKLTSVKDVWNAGYGDRWQLNSLFLALAKASGAEGYPVMVSKRDRHIFRQSLQNPHDVDGYVVELTLAGKPLFLDPGCQFAPYGQLPWYETGVEGRRLDRNGGTWERTTIFDSKSSGVVRSAKLKLNAHGSLEGDVTVTYSGEMALVRRTSERDEDAAARKKSLEHQMESDIPSGAEVSLTNEPEWNKSSPDLVAQYHIRIPGWAAAAGQRVLFPVSLFGGGEKTLFTHGNRVHPLYFSYPFFEKDDVEVTLAPQWKMASVPTIAPIEQKAFSYSMSGEEADGVLHLKRSLRFDFIVVAVAAYGTIQDWFDGIRNGDEQQAVLIALNDKSKH